jgi:hypothetical protein
VGGYERHAGVCVVGLHVEAVAAGDGRRNEDHRHTEKAAELRPMSPQQQLCGGVLSRWPHIALFFIRSFSSRE